MIQRLLPYFLLVCFVGMGVVVFWPSCIMWAPGNARRASCQSNLKQIGLAIRQYAQDYDNQLPLRHWDVPVISDAKTDAIFQCPETPNTTGGSDYFFNAHLRGVSLEKIETTDLPKQLILAGDGQDDAPLGTTLSLLPAAWRKDENSPAFRHIETANYLFIDGHVKVLKVNKIGADFRLVNP